MRLCLGLRAVIERLRPGELTVRSVRVIQCDPTNAEATSRSICTWISLSALPIALYPPGTRYAAFWVAPLYFIGCQAFYIARSAATISQMLALDPKAKDSLQTMLLVLLAIIFFPVMILWALMKKQK